MYFSNKLSLLFVFSLFFFFFVRFLFFVFFFIMCREPLLVAVFFLTWFEGSPTQNELTGITYENDSVLLHLNNTFFSKHIYLCIYLHKIFINIWFPSHTTSLMRTENMLYCLSFNLWYLNNARNIVVFDTFEWRNKVMFLCLLHVLFASVNIAFI